MKIHIDSSLYEVRVTTVRGDKWTGAFGLDHQPEPLEIIQAVGLDEQMALSGVELGGDKEAYSAEQQKWNRLRDVVEFAATPAESLAGRVECEVWTPGKRSQLGTIQIARRTVFINPSKSEPWGQG